MALIVPSDQTPGSLWWRALTEAPRLYVSGDWRGSSLPCTSGGELDPSLMCVLHCALRFTWCCAGFLDAGSVTTLKLLLDTMYIMLISKVEASLLLIALSESG